MFGFLTPAVQDMAFRRIYSRCCQHQHLNYGLLSLPLLNYESIFLYMCARDANANTPFTLPAQVCCRLRTCSTLRDAPDAEVGRFCSAFSLILAATKLQDDIRDGRSLKAHLYNWLLKKRLAAARLYLTTIDNQFGERIDQFVHRHLEIEKGEADITMEDYTLPTAEAFGYVFGLMALLPDVKVDRGTLNELGRRVGAALIAFDCAYDWHRDRANEEFNPLPDEASVRTAIDYCHDQLLAAAQICRREFGGDCQTAQVLLAVNESIGSREQPTIYDILRGRFRQWGFDKQNGTVQMNLDCGACLVLGCCCMCAGSMWDKCCGNDVHVYHHKGC